MKYVFLACGIALLLAGAAIHLTAPEVQNEVPVIYWVIDPAPARGEQIALFHRWLIKKGYGKEYTLRTMDELRSFRRRNWSPALIEAIEKGNADGPKVWAETPSATDLPITVRVPAVEMRLDAASNDMNKKLVQGVSGVAGDVIEAYSGGKQMQYLAAAGMLADVTESAKRLGFGPDQTYKALAPALFVDGRQYAFPRNPAQVMYWVNKETFEKVGQPLPPSRWTIEEFERRGKAFVDAANGSGERRMVFFADRACKIELRRSMGLSMFNETLTRCTLDDPRNARTMELIYRWTYKDHLLPSAADKASFDTEGGWGGQSFQLFKSGRYALFASGRWALMLFRKFGAMPLAVVEPPHAGLPNTILSGGQSTVYRASPHRKYAELFLAFMASADYNMQIVRDGDGLPPNPKYTDNELFRHPPKHPNEWGCHEAYAKAAKDIAIVQSFSPFVLPVTVERYDNMAEEEVMNDRATPQEAADRCAERINEEIQRTLRESPRLQKKYDDLLALQEKIDRHRREGKKIPLDWIKNPFHRTYYLKKGWAEAASSANGG
ncbi:MAG: extracellular solute-binding protein [Planctomycetes bacterium]|nr:extracellular solute-binding protein [Planctomycetota bacterium]